MAGIYITTFQLIRRVLAVRDPVTPVLTVHTLAVPAGPEPGRTGGGGGTENLVRHVRALRGSVTPEDGWDAVSGVALPLSRRTEGGRAGELVRAVRALRESVTARAGGGAGARSHHTQVVVTEELRGTRAELGTTAGLV